MQRQASRRSQKYSSNNTITVIKQEEYLQIPCTAKAQS